MAWNPQDTRGTDPVAGQPGHFDYVKWLKEGLVEAHNTIEAQAAKIAAAEAAATALAARVTALENAP